MFDHGPAVRRLVEGMDVPREREAAVVLGPQRKCEACQVTWWGGPVCWCCGRDPAMPAPAAPAAGVVVVERPAWCSEIFVPREEA